MLGQRKGQPLREGLTQPAAWHGGHSPSIPAEISCKHCLQEVVHVQSPQKV